MNLEFGVIRDSSNLGVIVDAPVIARRLLKMGHVIIDIKPNPNDRMRTRFIFGKNPNIQRDIEDIKESLLSKGGVSDGC